MSIHLSKEVSKLKKSILRLSSAVEENVRQAVYSVSRCDVELAEAVKANDHEIDSMEIDIEEECLKILALYQPVAIDLRYVIACLKMNNDLERIGDLAVNIGRRAIAVAKYDHGQLQELDFSEMMDKTRSMLKSALDCLIEMDVELACRVLASDDEIDELNRQMHLAVNKLIVKQPEKAEYYIHLLSVSRCLERIADYATNIAEDVIYMVKGSIVRHSPPS
jgi:phosphate transport system protein